MSKRTRDHEPRHDAGRYPGRGGQGWIQVLSLVGVAAILVVVALDYRENRRMKEQITEDLGGRIGALDSKVQQIAARIDQAPARRSGPDPSRVYTVRTEGSPARGPLAAPVVIAEFSDFQ